MLHFCRWNSLLSALVLSLMFASNSSAQEMDINQRDLSIIHLRAMESLRGYEAIINQMGEAIVNNPSMTRVLREQFLELYTSPEVMLFNDLDPSHSLSEFYEAETYINNLELSYPDGISIRLNLDNARVGKILSHGNDRYTLDVQLDKQIQGNYMNRQYSTNQEDLLFRIGFIGSGKDFRNFKIVGIRSADSDLVPNDAQSIEELYSYRLKENENSAIKQGIESLINDYSNFLALIGSEDETDFDKDQYSKSFKALFEFPDISIYNDLIPYQSQELTSIDAYLEFLRIHYPAGIKDMSITIDSIMFHKVNAEEQKVFNVIIDIDKFFSGMYDNTELYRSMVPLTFRISFQKEGKVFINYRIRSIEPEAEEIIESDTSVSMPVQVISSVTRKGLALEIFGSYGQTIEQDHHFYDENMVQNEQSWTYSTDFGLTFGAGLLWSFNDHSALETGVYYNQYNTTYSLDGEFMDSNLSYDVNVDPFYKVMLVHYDSAVTYNLISVPLTFTFTSSKPGKTGIYLSIGGLFSYGMSGSYKTDGSWMYYGYYPEHPEVIRELHIEELGFYNKEDIEENGKLEGGQINLSARASMGMSIPISYFAQFRLGPELEWGFSDFNSNEGEASDIFGNPKTHQPTYLFRFGIRLGLVVKL